MIGEPHVIFAEAAQRICMEVADDIVTEIGPLLAKATTRRSGDLARGYQAVEDGPGAAVINPAAPYWVHVEFGHVMVNPQTGEVVRDPETGEVKRVGQRAHVRPAIEAVRRKRLGE